MWGRDEPVDVQYLAFEGGGGKGAAYGGALAFLEQQGIIKYKGEGKPRLLDNTKIKGISGTSSGSIVATLLAMGYDQEEFASFFKENVASTFYDEPHLFRCPIIDVGEEYPSRSFSEDETKRKALVGGIGIASLFNDLSVLLAYPLPAVANPAFFVFLLKKLVKSSVGAKGGLGAVLAKNLPEYFLSLLNDFGLFTGEALLNWIDGKLYERFKRKDITLGQFAKATRIDLRIATTCITTRELVWLDSRGPWQTLSVAEAVRMSSGFPFAFKPVAIRSARGDCFLFSDGGLINNTPIHAFDDLNRKRRPLVEALLFGGREVPQPDVPFNNKILALRLTKACEQQAQQFDDLLSYGKGIANTILAQSESNQVMTLVERRHTLDLDVDGLETLEFEVKNYSNVWRSSWNQARDWWRTLNKLDEICEEETYGDEAPISIPGEG